MKNFRLSGRACATLVSIGVFASAALAEDNDAGMSGQAVAQAYIAGMEAGDLDSLNVLFVGDDRSSILENASDEGSWEHYRDHHLAPEMKAATGFVFTIADETEERMGDATLVRQTGAFSVEVGGEVRMYRVAVSYFIVEEDGQNKILHLHWSSRADRDAGH